MEASAGGTAYDTIIIGCGMAGLAAGIRLAMFGRRVVILERHNAPGGLNSFYFQGGRKFDVGLHAVTNYVEAGVKGTPLGKVFRQLRIPREAFRLSPQNGSRIAFMRDTDDGHVITGSDIYVVRADGSELTRLTATEEHYEMYLSKKYGHSSKDLTPGEISEQFITLSRCKRDTKMLKRERDMDFDQFVTLWRAIYEEGFGRPLEGVRVIIRALLDRYRALGGERRMRCGVRRIRLRRMKSSSLAMTASCMAETIHERCGE